MSYANTQLHDIPKGETFFRAGSMVGLQWRTRWRVGDLVLDSSPGLTEIPEQVKDLLPKDEPMTPGLLYVGIATLTGSVLGRSREWEPRKRVSSVHSRRILGPGSAPVRVILPPTALVLSLAYFLPKTFANVSDYTSSLEAAYVPSIHTQRLQLQHSLSKSLGTASKTYSSTKDSLGENVRWARKEVESKTGLKVAENAGQHSPVSTIAEQAKGAFARIQDETKKLGDKASGVVEGVVEEVKVKADKVLGDTGVTKEEEPPKRLV